ncbi:MAG: hypothetical protein KKD59_02290 [Acidobacteria bacterium]|nr:hypothetical protein [Acidobacteriota bacterium]MBU4329227.1 hypothetical protein [Acidobacteriota bacterium]
MSRRRGRTVGFSHYASLGIYLAAVGGISMQLVYNPDADTENLVSLYGENAVRIVSDPDNLEKIKAVLYND